MSDIYALIEAPENNIEVISAWLDQLADGEHYSALAQLSRQQQRQLFHKAAASAALSMQYFLPDTTPDLQEVIFTGRNTLPLFGKGKWFEKRMCRSSDGSGLVFGYNETTYKSWFGPGYFVLRETPQDSQWQQRGAVYVDYFSAPTGPVCAHWPPYRSNAWPPQALFYYHTRDFMRRVSRHVSIGVAYRNEQCLEHYFILVKQQAAE